MQPVAIWDEHARGNASPPQKYHKINPSFNINDRSYIYQPLNKVLGVQKLSEPCNYGMIEKFVYISPNFRGILKNLSIERSKLTSNLLE